MTEPKWLEDATTIADLLALPEAEQEQWDVADRDVRWPAERWHCEAVAVGLERDAGVCSPSNPYHNPPCGPIPAERCPGSGQPAVNHPDRLTVYVCRWCGQPTPTKWVPRVGIVAKGHEPWLRN